MESKLLLKQAASNNNFKKENDPSPSNAAACWIKIAVSVKIPYRRCICMELMDISIAYSDLRVVARTVRLPLVAQIFGSLLVHDVKYPSRCK